MTTSKATSPLAVEFKKDSTAPSVVATAFLNILAHPGYRNPDPGYRIRFPRAIAALHLKGPRADGRAPSSAGPAHELRSMRPPQVLSAISTANARLNARYTAALAAVDTLHDLGNLGIKIDLAESYAAIRREIGDVSLPWKRIAEDAEGPVGKDANGKCPSNHIQRDWSASKPVLHLAIGFFVTRAKLVLASETPDVATWGCWEFVCNANMWIADAISVSEDALERTIPLFNLDEKKSHRVLYL